MLAALATHSTVPVPRPLALCEDKAVLGTAFYLMDFIDGRVEEDPAIPSATPAARTAMWRDAVATLAKLHAVDRHAVGLADFGKASGFYPRQLDTWRAICAAQAAARDVDTGRPVGQMPHFDEMVAFFADAARQPADRAALVHGDYKIDNVVFHRIEPQVIGILE